jgi:class 3 adenylate cyclase
MGCGAPLAQACGGCDAELPQGASFCPSCGRAVESADASAAPAADPKSYTPRHLAAKILTWRSDMQGERKRVSALFCDVVGSTGLTQ